MKIALAWFFLQSAMEYLQTWGFWGFFGTTINKTVDKPTFGVASS